VIDNRWREHLFDMDYLREGIHLRSFAQIDPIVAYKNEGYLMFQELMHSIWDEYSKLVFRAEIEVDPAQLDGATMAEAEPELETLDYSGGTPDAQPSALREVAAASGASAVDIATAQAAGPTNGGGVVETVVKDEHENIGRNDPCWCGSGKKFKKCHGA
jgi:preprotein translocase subunit SecA